MDINPAIDFYLLRFEQACMQHDSAALTSSSANRVGGCTSTMLKTWNNMFLHKLFKNKVRFHLRIVLSLVM